MRVKYGIDKCMHSYSNYRIVARILGDYLLERRNVFIKWESVKRVNGLHHSPTSLRRLIV